MIRRPPISTLFPYTTLFRSLQFFAVPGVTAEELLVVGTLLVPRSEEHTSELQSRFDLVCRLLLEKKNKRDARHLRSQNQTCLRKFQSPLHQPLRLTLLTLQQ